VPWRRQVGQGRVVVGDQRDLTFVQAAVRAVAAGQVLGFAGWLKVAENCVDVPEDDEIADAIRVQVEGGGRSWCRGG
jgi:hypothetical protein